MGTHGTLASLKNTTAPFVLLYADQKCITGALFCGFIGITEYTQKASLTMCGKERWQLQKPTEACHGFRMAVQPT